MSRQNLVNQTFTAENVGADKNGKFVMFESEEITLQNINSLSVDIRYGRVEPVFKNADLEAGTEMVLPNYRIFAFLETKDDAGNWTLLHTQSYAHTPSNPNKDYSLDIDPTFNIPEGKHIVDDSGIDGVTIISAHRYQKRVPNNFKLILQLLESGHGTPGAFKEADILVSYTTE